MCIVTLGRVSNYHLNKYYILEGVLINKFNNVSLANDCGSSKINNIDSLLVYINRLKVANTIITRSSPTKYFILR